MNSKNDGTSKTNAALKKKTADSAAGNTDQGEISLFDIFGEVQDLLSSEKPAAQAGVTSPAPGDTIFGQALLGATYQQADKLAASSGDTIKQAAANVKEVFGSVTKNTAKGKQNAAAKLANPTTAATDDSEVGVDDIFGGPPESPVSALDIFGPAPGQPSPVQDGGEISVEDIFGLD